MKSKTMYWLLYNVMRDDHKRKLKNMLKDKAYSREDIDDFVDSLKDYYAIPSKREYDKNPEIILGNCLCNIRHLTKEQRKKIWDNQDKLFTRCIVYGEDK